jgi:NAD-dependent deacetylase
LHEAGRLQMLVTQNIDGLHERAGIPRHMLVELHGTNARIECQACGAEADLAACFDSFKKNRMGPRCQDCGGPLKPATISFGQNLKTEDLERAAQAARACDLVVALGSSLSVYPAAEFPLLAARRGVPYAIVNRGVTEHDGIDLVSLRLEGDVAELFPPAVEAVL